MGSGCLLLEGSLIARSPRNSPAGEDKVVLLEDAGLPGGDDALGNEELHLHPAPLRQRDGRAAAGMKE